VNPLHFGFDASIKPYPYDRKRAKKLLAEAGYPNGFEMTLNTYSGTITQHGPDGRRRHRLPGQGGHQSSSGAISRTWACGPRPARRGKLEGLQYYSWGSNSIFDADAIMYALAYSKEPLSIRKDAVLDQLLDEGRTQIDPRKRQEGLRQGPEAHAREVLTGSPSTSSTPSRESTRSSTTRRAATNDAGCIPPPGRIEQEQRGWGAGGQRP